MSRITRIKTGAMAIALIVSACGSDEPSSEFRSGVRDSRNGRMPAGSVPCDELREVIRVAVEIRRRAGLHPERIRGQVHGKYQTVMRECGVPGSAIPSGD